MTLILGFAPFILFEILSRLSGDLALWIAFAAAFVVTIRDFVERPVLRLLDGAGLFLFAVLALGHAFLMPELSLAAVRLAVDAGFTLVLLYSLVRRQPFSLQYAGAPGRGWSESGFRKTNYVISAGWAGAFLAITIADLVVLAAMSPLYAAILVDIAALAAAAGLTFYYPQTGR